MNARVRRNALSTTLAAVAASLVSVSAWGQEYPAKVAREQNIKPE